jgi:hypothetical protein
MKTVRFTWVVLGVMYLQLPACAGSEESEQTQGIRRLEAAQTALRHSLDVGPEVYYYHYEESDVTMSGVFYGITGAYTYRPWAPVPEGETLDELFGLMLRGEGRYAQGGVHYDGEYLSGEPLEFGGKDDYVAEVRFLVGPDFALGKALATIYTGLGYRHLSDDSSGHLGDYDRKSNYCYLPIGITAERRTDKKWVLGSTIEFDVLLHGTQKTYLGDAGLDDFDQDQNSGYGVRVSAKFERKGKRDFIIEPFLRTWHIEDSESDILDDAEYWEPENTTVEVGVDVLIRF